MAHGLFANLRDSTPGSVVPSNNAVLIAGSSHHGGVCNGILDWQGSVLGTGYILAADKAAPESSCRKRNVPGMDKYVGGA